MKIVHKLKEREFEKKSKKQLKPDTTLENVIQGKLTRKIILVSQSLAMKVDTKTKNMQNNNNPISTKLFTIQRIRNKTYVTYFCFADESVIILGNITNLKSIIKE